MTAPSAATRKPTLSRDYFWYFTGNILVMVAGMLSLPVTSRLLTNTDFGILGYYETFATLWIAVLKLGIQHSALRWHPTHCLGKSAAEQKRFYATFIWCPAGASLLITVTAVLVLLLLSDLKVLKYPGYLAAALVLSGLTVVGSFVQNLMAAERKSDVLAATNASLRWLQLAFVIPTIVFISRSAAGVFGARIAAAGAVATWLIIWMSRHAGIAIRSFSWPLFVQALAFGFPMAMNEAVVFIHDQIDRVLLKHYLDFSAVGIYHINYSVASYLGMVLITSFYPAFTPFAYRLYDLEGAAIYRERVAKMLRPMYYLGVALTVGVLTGGKPLLRMFIGAKADPHIFAVVALTFILSSVGSTFTHGLVLEKLAKTALLTIVISCFINIGANMVLIPKYGIMGAAYSTLISCFALAVMRTLAAPRETWPVDHWTAYFRPAALGVFLYASIAVVNRVFALGDKAQIFASAGLGVVLFAVPTLYLDRSVREEVLRRLPASARRLLAAWLPA